MCVQELDLNRVTITSTDDSDKTSNETKTFDLQSNDRLVYNHISSPVHPLLFTHFRFWYTHRGSPFPSVADSVQNEVSEYKTKEEEITRLRTAMVYNECVVEYILNY